MIDFTLQIEEKDILAELAATEMLLARKMALAMEQIGFEVVSFLRSIGHGQQPAARPGEPNRSAHPGSWADITSNLANSYRFELYSRGQMVRWIPEWTPVADDVRGQAQPVVVQGSYPPQVHFPVELQFLNGMEYAAALEAKDGYWVLREITGNGGPVARATRAVLNATGANIRIEGI